MEVYFDIKRHGYITAGNLWFKIHNKVNHFIFKINMCNCEDLTCINSYYFSYEVASGNGGIKIY